ncbi:hypothetical protein [Oceanobacillus kapialis]|uniref:Transcriptional regulator n=1 Tax=Oceanobacillus kapialis TaxID=481353 RepID=A0ABW5PVS1_9BACI
MELTKDEKRDRVKLIEFYLKNYRTFKVANSNLQKQLELLMNVDQQNLPSMQSVDNEKLVAIRKNYNETLLIEKSIENAVYDLSPIEQQFINSRYFKRHSIEKTAQTIGYSKASVYVLRSRIMDKLLISLGVILNTSLQSIVEEKK